MIRGLSLFQRPMVWGSILAPWLVCIGMSSDLSLAASRTEDKVKAAFVYHFVQFAEWPTSTLPDTETQIHVCVFQEDPFNGFLEKTLMGKTIKSRGFDIRYQVPIESIDSCHVLFVSRWGRTSQTDIQRIFEASKALTIGETADFLELGGMIQVYRANNRIRFAVNPDALKRKDIHLSSKLLRLAKIVRKE